MTGINVAITLEELMDDDEIISDELKGLTMVQRDHYKN